MRDEINADASCAIHAASTKLSMAMMEVATTEGRSAWGPWTAQSSKSWLTSARADIDRAIAAIEDQSNQQQKGEAA
jgi:hypothetical protein